MSLAYLIREDDRTMAALQRGVRDRKRKVRRQSPVVFRDDVGEESGSDDESTKTKIKTQTPSAPSPVLSTSSTSQRVSTTSQISTTTPNFISTTQKPSLQQTTTFATSSTSTSEQRTTILASITPQPRRPVSSIVVEIETSASASPTPVTLIPDAGTINEAVPVQQTRTHKTLSHGATIALEVLGVLLAISVFLLIGFLIHRRIKKRSKTPPPTLTSSPTRDTFSESKPPVVTRTAQPVPFLIRIFTARSASSIPSEKANITRSEYTRTVNLSRVNPELLSQQNLNSQLMRSHTRTISTNPLLNIIPDDDTTTAKETTRKAFLKRNTSGKMVMKPSSQAKKFSFGYAPREEDEGRVVIDASGEWDDARTVARASAHTRTGPTNDALLKPLAGLMAAQKAVGGGNEGGEAKMLGVNDPTLMSGGLRHSTYTLPALKGLDNRKDGVPYQSQPASEVESGALGLGLGALEGLRKGEDRDEFGRLAKERQSMMSGTVRSTTSWNTSVWERLEKERVGKKGREVLEGGLGGAGSRVSTATTVAHWRGMGNWVEDQVERRGKNGNREKEGMERLDG